VDEIVETVERIAPSFGGINLEDIRAPERFEVEARLIDSLDIPICHDDQHGTAVISAAALLNTLELTGRSIEEVRVVFSGARFGPRYILPKPFDPRMLVRVPLAVAQAAMDSGVARLKLEPAEYTRSLEQRVRDLESC
jgi:malic enzyme